MSSKGRRETRSVSGRRSRPGRPKGPRRPREERREDLLDAAERAIRRVGPHASMDELAAEAGITKPILYSHFGDRAGMAAALAERTADVLITELSDALREAAATGSAKAVTRSAIEAFCDFIEREPSLYRFLVRNTFDGGYPLSSCLATEVATRITKLLGRALRETGADSGAAEPWAFGAVGLSFAGAEWWLERRTMTKGDLVEYLTQLLWGGLAGAGLGRLEIGGTDNRDVEASNVTQLNARRPAAES